MSTFADRFISCAVVFFLTSIITGCGGSSEGPKLVTVSGKITLNDAPLPNGDIIFRPANGTGHAYAGKITDGNYSIETEIGEKRVEIKSMREVPGKTTEDNPGEVVNVREQIVPTEYNSESTLKTTVPKEGSSNTDFQLKGDPPKPKS